MQRVLTRLSWKWELEPDAAPLGRHHRPSPCWRCSRERVTGQWCAPFGEERDRIDRSPRDADLEVQVVPGGGAGRSLAAERFAEPEALADLEGAGCWGGRGGRTGC